MTEYRVGDKEKIFANLIWENEPITSGELVRLAKENLAWQKSTTYTVLRRLIERGLFANRNGVVSSVVGRHEFESGQCRQFVSACFGGSLPSFLSAFSDGKKLTEEEIRALERIIEENRHFEKEHRNEEKRQ